MPSATNLLMSALPRHLDDRAGNRERELLANAAFQYMYPDLFQGLRESSLDVAGITELKKRLETELNSGETELQTICRAEEALIRERQALVTEMQRESDLEWQQAEELSRPAKVEDEEFPEE